MNDFAQAAMTRPLFEEPSDASTRSDPWSGPQGFMIGGMALPTKAELGQQYFDAANIILEAIVRCECEDYRLANPALFLYRHWLELTIKSLIGPEVKGHDLANLAELFESAVRDRFGVQLPSWVAARLKEIAAIDPNSTAFRYGENYDKQRKVHVEVDGELYVSLTHLQEITSALKAIFQSLGVGWKPNMGTL